MLLALAAADGRQDRRVTYRERTTLLAGATLWRSTAGPRPKPRLILPDGCLDLLWDGRRLFVAGPDTRARWHQAHAQASYLAIRFSGGTGPALLGVPADEVCDRMPDLDELWPSRDVRNLTEQVATDPVTALEAWMVERAAARTVDAWGSRVLEMASAGMPVAVMAERLGLSARQLHRRCLPVFGYGPRRLTRIQRMSRALEHARAGAPLAQVAAACRYVDQAHFCREVQALAGTTPARLLQELDRG
jgi:AraC-like DNA-binding protein